MSTIRKRSTWRIRLTLGAALGMLLVLAPAPASAGHKRGTLVEINGRVVDQLGAPLSKMTVILEATRQTFSFSRMSQHVDGVLQRPTVADERGAFTIDWRWDKQYKKLELVAGVPRSDGSLVVLARQDITATAGAHTTVDAALLVETVPDLELLRRIVAGRASVDERKVFDELGRPDRLEPREDELGWWYFEQGRMYRFRDGKLLQVVPFEAVKE